MTIRALVMGDGVPCYGALEIVGLLLLEESNCRSKVEGTHRVQTHAIKLLTLTIPHVGHPKVIPYTKFEHFGIFHFCVMPSVGVHNKSAL